MGSAGTTLQDLNTEVPVYADESIMAQKKHGTCDQPVMKNLLYGVDHQTADRVCCFNRHFAEHSGYAFQSPRTWMKHLDGLKENEEVTYYDPVTGKPLFIAPRGRSTKDFIKESKDHGWPSFRDEEVVWENVRVLKGDGETVSTAGVHLGHRFEDRKGNRYCINLVSMAGSPTREEL